MTLTKRGAIAKKRRKKILKLSKGFQGSHSKLFKAANQKIMRALTYSHKDRKKKKRIFRNIWIKRINNESKKQNFSYNKTINILKKKNIKLNKKIISEIIIWDNITFKNLVAKNLD